MRRLSARSGEAARGRKRMAILRTSRKRREAPASRRALWTVIGLTVIICLPVIATVIMVSQTAQPALFDLVPTKSHSNGFVILAWPDLERARRALAVGTIATGTRLLALGYMMAGDQVARDGDSVNRFLLFPDAGNALHPAHHFGDQMIAVQLQPGSTIHFSERNLLWVRGILYCLPGDPNGDRPLYRMENAQAAIADKRDIRKYFR